MPNDWLAYQRLPDGRLFGFHRVNGSTGLFSNDGEIIWETKIFAPDYFWAKQVDEGFLVWSVETNRFATKIAMLNQDGSVEWKIELPIYATGIPPQADNGTSIFVGQDKVIAISIDGEILWTTSRPIELNQSSFIQDETVIVFSSGGEIAALDLNGELLWEEDNDFIIRYVHLLDEAKLALVDARVGVNSFLCAFDFQGTEQWRFDPPNGGLGTTFLGDDGLIYYPVIDDDVYVVSQSGQLQQPRHFESEKLLNLLVDRHGNAIAMQGDLIFNDPISKLLSGQVQSLKYRIEKFDADDNLLWSYRLDSPKPYL